ncbi:hypothetical protein OESDEN_20259 [Oesophagostomum dentatum]|uniref:Uncharacterized protein n=1 Tax=Oesophagostomum dentatum TaxID=61180 RepID=A0A0B1S990_OESDE|nr:hypothetical protein OESDEN_20259 [Oesophagostomum dentatum]
MVESTQAEMNSMKASWDSEKEGLLKEMEDLKSHAAMDTHLLIESKNKEIADLKTTLLEAETTKDIALRELQQRHALEIKGINEELRQLRKDNMDLNNRIDMLLVETEPSDSDRGEVQILKEEIAELKEVIEMKSKALEVADKHKNELELSTKMVEVLKREKKELTARLKTKTDSAAVLSSRINALRDEINEKQAQLRNYELNNEKLKDDNESLENRYSAMEAEFLAFRKETEISMREKDAKIAQATSRTGKGQPTQDSDLGY